MNGNTQHSLRVVRARQDPVDKRLKGTFSKILGKFRVKSEKNYHLKESREISITQQIQKKVRMDKN